MKIKLEMIVSAFNNESSDELIELVRELFRDANLDFEMISIEVVEDDE